MSGWDRDARRTALLASPLFRVMRAADLETVLDHAVVRSYRRGHTIYQQGDAGSAMMAVLEGRARMVVASPDGKEIVLNIIEPGDIFGEMALIDGKPRSADAVAALDTTLLVVERRHFRPLLESNHELVLRLLDLLCDRLRRTSLTVEDVALFDVPDRLARVLTKLAEDYGVPTPSGLRISLRLSQKDLSNLVASSREAVNKQLMQWRDEGLILSESGYVVLPTRDVLMRWRDARSSGALA